MIGRQGWVHLVYFLFPIVVAAPCWAQSKATNDWRQKISSQLQSHIHFPAEACGKNGEARVAFTLDRTGKLISSKLVSGTGFRVLDEAAVEILKSAQPFPQAPPEVADGDLNFVISLIFGKLPGTTEEINKHCEAARSESRVPGVMRSICRGC
jgi:protein TonB